MQQFAPCFLHLIPPLFFKVYTKRPVMLTEVSYKVMVHSDCNKRKGWEGCVRGGGFLGQSVLISTFMT